MLLTPDSHVLCLQERNYFCSYVSDSRQTIFEQDFMHHASSLFKKFDARILYNSMTKYVCNVRLLVRDIPTRNIYIFDIFLSGYATKGLIKIEWLIPTFYGRGSSNSS